jgi:hypothetical protein
MLCSGVFCHCIVRLKATVITKPLVKMLIKRITEALMKFSRSQQVFKLAGHRTNRATVMPVHTVSSVLICR